MSDSLILNYHAVSPTWPASLSVEPESLERHLSIVAKRRYQPVTAAALLNPQRARTLTVTFDDGYESVFRLAFPVLASLGVVATVFVVTKFVGSSEPMAWPGIDHWRGTPHEGELISLNWDQVAYLADAGWEIGSHTYSHPDLTELSQEDLRHQLRSSRECIEERIGRPCISLAYPYGAHDDRVTRAACDAGYQIAFTAPETFKAPEPLRWPRIGIYHEETRFSFQAKISPAVRRLRGGVASKYLYRLWRVRR